MYGIFAGIWNLLAGSKSISDLKTGGLIPPYRSLKKWIWKYFNIDVEICRTFVLSTEP